MPTVDGSAIQDFAAIPADTYDAVLAEAEYHSDKQYYAFKFRITEGDHVNRQMFRNVSIKPTSLWAFKAACVALGADPSAFEGEFDTDDILEPLIGEACRIKVGVQGEDAGEFAGRNQVDKILAPSYGGFGS